MSPRRRKTRLKDAYRFHRFTTLDEVHEHRDDPGAFVLCLVRTGKKTSARAAVDGTEGAFTTPGSSVFGIYPAETTGYTSMWKSAA
jgi:hypothetical protein